MKKVLTPTYIIDEEDNEDAAIKDKLNFCISPYLEETSEESQKIFNSLLSNEKVYTEKMLAKAIGMLKEVRKIISDRIDMNVLERNKYANGSQNFLLCQHLLNNYNRQLALLSDLDKIFSFQ